MSYIGKGVEVVTFNTATTLDVAGNVTVGGTVDGRDVATDGTKLDTITSGAIADIVQDTTPQLGGNLDLNTSNVIGTGNINVTGSITGTSFVSTGDMSFTNNSKAIFGTSPSLEIYHDGSNSILDDVGAGNFKMQLAGADKLEITSTGVDVTGTVTATAFSGDGSALTGITIPTLSSLGIANHDQVTVDGSGNVTVTGTVDGRDVATDGTKLDGIEAGATADQTGAEIKAAYEAEANTNAFTDAEKTKLAGAAVLTGATFTGAVTATSFTGDGANLTNLPVSTPTLSSLGIANHDQLTVAANGDVTVGGTGAITVPSGTTAQRPTSPALGMIRQNTTLDALEIYDGTNWSIIRSFFTATGGTISDAGGYRYHTFTSSGTFTVSQGSTSVDCLIVAGGGGGGAGWYAGGGGAGGMVTASGVAVSTGTYSIVVGAGGNGSTSTSTTASNGTNSSALSQTTAIGGGGGASRGQQSGTVGGSGGSGGGAAYPSTSGGSGTSGQGNAGGSNGVSLYGASGGGAGGAGLNGTGFPYGANGASGSQWLDGSYYAGGGASGTDTSATRTGGIGGGGNSSSGASVSCTDGTANTGGGGGGGSGVEHAASGLSKPYAGANGGSGIVIIRYAV